ncbi:MULTISPECIES: RNA polymerase sigma factor [Novosphingobium]|uniref:Sigma-70 family RNA polymerase sigma factor n=1 Tax=Novosphingobium mangrovi (ex Huang et al. 2023) TaxID=2976432 RepID=A0ABT2I7Z2_9SPHN|nr:MULTISPECIES: sigma factor [Novosphingobium]MCT2400913.1 sigma-70 family RNA polymerase sigma factor [Novosphingobium mangrovi (ex Huang et al. 2023)]CCA93204.1 RNA polymerase, sigma-24 subunit, ECF subfamily [Novosphingobium sp. PP1Y]
MFDICPNNETHTEEGDSFGGDAADETKRRIVRKELASCYQRYRVMAARRLRDEIAADDVVQAFALKALERFEQLRDVEAVHGWLRRLFETTLIDFCRRRGTRGQREVAFELEIHDRPHEALTDSVPDPERTIVSLMSNIKQEYADVIYRLDLKDQRKEDAARELGITVNNLTVRAHRARRALRDAIETVSVSFNGAALASVSSACSPAFALARS